MILKKDMTGTNTVSITLLSGFFKMLNDRTTLYSCIDHPYTTSADGNTFFLSTGCEQQGRQLNYNVVSIVYKPGGSGTVGDQQSFIVTFKNTNVNGGGDDVGSSYVLTSVAGSKIMKVVTDTINQYLVSNGLLNTSIPLPTLTDTQINNDAFRQITRTIPLFYSCFGCTVDDAKMRFKNLTKLGFNGLEIMDTLMHGNVPGKDNDYKMTSELRLIENNKDGFKITTDGWSIDTKCRCGIDVWPFKQSDDWHNDMLYCNNVNATLVIPNPISSLMTIEWIMNLDNGITISSIDKVSFTQSISHINSIFSNCDKDTETAIGLAKLFGKYDNINQLLQGILNNILLKDTVPNLLKDNLNQNLPQINLLISQGLADALKG
jgi:hypothetical protein